MTNKKSTAVISAVAIIALVLMVVGATYAYFAAQGGNSVTRDVTVTTHTVDTLTFDVSNNISIEASQFDFGPGTGDKFVSSTITATLSPNSKTGAATEHYSVYLRIDNNPATIIVDPETGDSMSELFLQVYDDSFEYWCIVESSELENWYYDYCFVDPSESNIWDIFNGNEYIESEETCQYYLGLLEDDVEQYLEENPDDSYPSDYEATCEKRTGKLIELSGFENTNIINDDIAYGIAGINRLIPLLENKEITASNGNVKTENIRVVITLKNLNINQTNIMGKQFNASLIVQKEAFEYSGTLLGVIDNDESYGINGINFMTGGEVSGHTYRGLEKYYFPPTNNSLDHYFKHEIQNNIIIDTEVCLNENGNELCLGSDYWDTNEATTMAKLQADMENLYGNNINCSIDLGDVICSHNQDNYTSCRITNNYARCNGFYIQEDGSFGKVGAITI